MRKYNFHKLLATSVVLLTTGCSMVPTYERPALPVSESFPDYIKSNSNELVSVAKSQVTDLVWQNFFTDIKLKQLIERSLISNRDLRIAVLNIELAKAQYQIKRADQFPSVSAVLNGSRTPAANGSSTNLYNVGLAVTAYELDFFGRINSLKEVALAQYLATEEGRKTAQINLIASVANTYLNILADDALIEITRKTLVSRQASFKLSQLRFENGVSSEVEFRLAESLLETARIAFAQQTRQRALDENALVLLVGQPLDKELSGILSNTPAKVAAVNDALNMENIPAGLPSDLIVNRPDIQQAEQLLLASNANIGAARAAFFPRISLTVGAGSISSQLSGLLKNGSWGWTLAPQLLLPIFDAGRNQSGLDSAKVARDIALNQYDKTIQTAFREVADALVTRSTLAEQLRSQQAQTNAEEVRFKLSDLRYQQGVSSSLDLLDAQRSLFAAQQAVVQTRLALSQSQVTLYKTLGGGWANSK